MFGVSHESNFVYAICLWNHRRLSLLRALAPAVGQTLAVLFGAVYGGGFSTATKVKIWY